MTRGRIAGILAAVVVAAVVGAVLGFRGSGSPVASAATKTSATSAHLAFSLTLRSPKLGHAVRVDGSGAVDGPSADVTIQDSGAPATVPSSFHALLLQQDGHELAFVHATPMPSFVGGKAWVEVDLSKLASGHGIESSCSALTSSACALASSGGGASSNPRRHWRTRSTP